MKSLYFAILFCAIFIYSSESIAAVTVMIVDAPDKTLLYSPIRITAVIENVGNSTEAISLDWGFEVNSGNEFIPLPRDWQYDGVENFVAILDPGEKYYISEFVGQTMESVFKKKGEGVYELRIILSGSGECPSYINKTYTLQRDLSAPGERAICWKGKVYSEPVKIAVENPNSKEDLEVLEFVKSGKALNLMGSTEDWSAPYPTRSNFSHSYRFLLDKYPNNYYTYVAGLHNAAGSGNSHLVLMQFLELQPQNPLRKYALLSLAEEEIHHHWPLDKRIDSDLPSSLREFIKQYKKEFESMEQAAKK